MILVKCSLSWGTPSEHRHASLHPALPPRAQCPLRLQILSIKKEVSFSRGRDDQQPKQGR